MTLKYAKTWKERGLQVQAVRDKCNAIISKLKVLESDVRAQAIIHVRQCCNTSADVSIKLSQNARLANCRPAIRAIPGLQDNSNIEGRLSDFNKNSKASFLTVVQFALENCIKQILEALPGERARAIFKDSAERLIKVSGIKRPAEKLELIMLPAWMRNILHANGVHHRKDKSVTVDGAVYSFKKDRQISCGSWSHILHAILHSLDVYEEILLSPKVAAIDHISSA